MSVRGNHLPTPPDLLVGYTAASSERLFAIMLMGCEAELHSQAGCARWRGGVPERRPAPQFPPRGRWAAKEADPVDVVHHNKRSGWNVRFWG